MKLALTVLPWLAVTALCVGVAARAVGALRRVSTGSTLVLERRLLFLGTLPLHLGVAALSAGHAAFLFGGADRLLVTRTSRLFVESAGVAAGLLCAGGLALLLLRRAVAARVRATTRSADVALLAVLLLQATTGVQVAASNRWVSAWAPELVTPYLRSALTLAPDVGAVASLPFSVQLHLALGWVLVALVPFTRLAHMWAAPLTIVDRVRGALSARSGGRR